MSAQHPLVKLAGPVLVLLILVKIMHRFRGLSALK